MVLPLGDGITDEDGEKGDGDEEVDDEDLDDDDETRLLLVLWLLLLSLVSSPPVDDNIWRGREPQRKRKRRDETNKEGFDGWMLVVQ